VPGQLKLVVTRKFDTIVMMRRGRVFLHFNSTQMLKCRRTPRS
jgi:hypothetical protein